MINSFKRYEFPYASLSTGQTVSLLFFSQDSFDIKYSTKVEQRIQTYIELLLLHRDTWNHLTVCKQMNDVNYNY